MKKIYKYPLHATTYQELLLPEGAQILSAKEQNGNIVVYALIDLDTGRIPRPLPVLVLPTGQDVDGSGVDSYDFVDTVKMHDGKLMFHVFKSKIML